MVVGTVGEGSVSASLCAAHATRVQYIAPLHRFPNSCERLPVLFSVASNYLSLSKESLQCLNRISCPFKISTI